MTMPLFHRIVNQCSLNISFNEDAYSSTFSMKDAILKIKQLTDSKEITKLYDKGSVLLKISEVQVFDGYACLLISKIDKETADVVYSNIETLKRREIKKAENEGNTVCCHILISLNAASSVSLNYNCVVERVYGIGLISDIKSFLQYVFREYVSFNINNKNIAPKLELMGRECKTVRETLSNCILSKVKFSKRREFIQGIDQPNYVAVEEKSILITSRPTGSDAINLLSNLLTLHRANYTSACITIIDGKQQKTNELTLDSDEIINGNNKRDIDDILGEAFFKPEKVTGFDEKLEVAYASIRQDLVQKMFNLL